jgi:hypothetical protein
VIRALAGESGWTPPLLFISLNFARRKNSWPGPEAASKASSIVICSGSEHRTNGLAVLADWVSIEPGQTLPEPLLIGGRAIVQQVIEMVVHQRGYGAGRVGGRDSFGQRHDGLVLVSVE